MGYLFWRDFFTFRSGTFLFFFFIFWWIKISFHLITMQAGYKG